MHYLHVCKAWKKSPGKIALDGNAASEFNRIHVVNEVRAPRMGGLVIWASVLITIIGIAIVAHWVPGIRDLRFSFLSRSQTWIPLATLLVGAVVGFFDDVLVIRPGGTGIRLSVRLLIVCVSADVEHVWFWDAPEHVDPVKEEDAEAIRISTGNTTDAAECARKGMDFEDVYEQRAYEMSLRKSLGLPEHAASTPKVPSPTAQDAQVGAGA